MSLSTSRSQETSPVATPRTPEPSAHLDLSPVLALNERPGQTEEAPFDLAMLQNMVGKENMPTHLQRAARRQNRLTPRRLENALTESPRQVTASPIPMQVD